MTREPISTGMDGVVARPPRAELPVDHLLRHCLGMGAAPAADTRPPVQARLEKALGPELARQLVSSLTGTRRS